MTIASRIGRLQKLLGLGKSARLHLNDGSEQIVPEQRLGQVMHDALIPGSAGAEMLKRAVRLEESDRMLELAAAVARSPIEPAEEPDLRGLRDMEPLGGVQ